MRLKWRFDTGCAIVGAFRQIRQMDRPLDLITIGRSSVDLYGGQVGGRLEDMATFSKYIGGSPTNIAVGASRLGLAAALITRVGDEHMGRFIREELEREGVDVRCVRTDPDRLTALVLLGIRDDSSFPLIFYREDCADMALSEDDIDPDFIAEARCVCVTGTHLSNPRTEAAVLKALNLARRSGTRTALDIDYRPNLWGLAGHGQGESRFIESQRVTGKLQTTLGLFDLIVGTEEEFHIAGGSSDTLDSLAEVRSHSAAALVCKRGPLGAIAFESDIPGSLEEGQTGPGIDVEVFNVLGAGDGFMAGLLKGWLADQGWPETLKIANACGAFSVSRHGCAPSYPSMDELEFFFRRGKLRRALRKDTELEQVHWATTRTPQWPVLRIFDCSGIRKLRHMDADGRLAGFPDLCLKAAELAAGRRTGFGIVLDDQTGRSALYRAAESGLWIGRCADRPETRPLAANPELGLDLGGLAEWPLGHTVHVRCQCHPKDDDAMWNSQLAALRHLFSATRRCRLELMLHIESWGIGAVKNRGAAAIVDRIYGSGIFPDWWGVEAAQSKSGWSDIGDAVLRHDPNCRGIVVSADGVSSDDLCEWFDRAAGHRAVKGFANDPALIVSIAEAWIAGAMDDEGAVKELALSFQTACEKFDFSIARSRPPQ